MNKPDDETPLDDEWLAAVGFEKRDGLWQHDGDGCGFELHEDGGYEFAVDFDDSRICKRRRYLAMMKTRGDVRRLVVALNGQLPEQT